jgi:hypothetical protein
MKKTAGMRGERPRRRASSGSMPRHVPGVPVVHRRVHARVLYPPLDAVVSSFCVNIMRQAAELYATFLWWLCSDGA